MARQPKSPFAHLNRARLEDQAEPDENRHTPDTEDPDTPQPGNRGEDNPNDRAGRHGDNHDPDNDSPVSEDEMDAEDEQEDEEDRKAEEEDTEEDREVREDAKARASSRARAIFRRPEAASNLALACHLAFSTDMTRRQAVAALRAASGGRRSRRRTSSYGVAGSTATLRSRRRTGAVTPLKADARQSGSSLVDGSLGFRERTGLNPPQVRK